MIVGGVSPLVIITGRVEQRSECCRCFDDDARPGSHGRDVDEYVSANKVKIGKNQLLLSPIVCIVIAIATRF